MAASFDFTPRRRRVATRAAAALLLSLCVATPLAASPEQAARQAQQRTGGQVLSVKTSADPQRPGYFVKVLLDDGRVRVVYVRL